MPANAERQTEIVRQRADVGARAARDLEPHLRLLAGLEPRQVEPADVDRRRRALDHSALAVEPVQGLAVDLLRRSHRRDLVDGAAEQGQHRFDGRLCQMPGRPRFDHLARRVVAVGEHTQDDRRGVVLVAAAEVLHQPRGLPEAEHQQAGGRGIEGATMADATGAEQPADLVDDVMRGPAGVLVEQQQSAGFHAQDSGDSRGSPSSARSSRNNSSSRCAFRAESSGTKRSAGQ